MIDPVALKGDQWFLGNIYAYAHQGSYFGVPMTNFAGWAIVGSVSLLLFRWLELSHYPDQPVPKYLVKQEILLGVGLYYYIPVFILGMTFWIGEVFLGIIGSLLYIAVTVLFLVKMWRVNHQREGVFPGSSPSSSLKAFKKI